MPIEVPLTELTVIDAEELHLVGRGANGFPQLFAKAVADEVEDELAKATVSTKDQNDLPDSDFAYIEPGGEKDADGKTTPRSKRHFPIMDAAHVRNALARAGQSPFGDKAMPKIKAAAKKFGIDLAKDTMTIDQSDPTIPGSGAWEANDAEALIEAGQLLATAASKLTVSANRERMEVAAGHADDMADVYDLSDAVCIVQNALSIVARVAFTEEAEAQSAGSMAGSMVKSVRSPETADAIRKVIGELSLLTKAIDPGGAAVGYQKGATMALDITTEELGALIKSAVTEAVPAAVDAAIEAKAEADKEALAKAAADAPVAPVVTPPAAPAADPLAKDAPVVPAVATDPAAPAVPVAPAVTDNEALIKSIVDANRTVINEAVEPLSAKIDAQDERIEELSKSARPGGPMVSVPGTGRSNDASTGEVDLTALQEKFEKAVGSEKSELGERLTKLRLLEEYGVKTTVKANA